MLISLISRSGFQWIKFVISMCPPYFVCWIIVLTMQLASCLRLFIQLEACQVVAVMTLCAYSQRYIYIHNGS